MPLIRCSSCRYSFEHNADESPSKCVQCGERLQPSEGSQADDGFERQKTQKLKAIPKPND